MLTNNQLQVLQHSTMTKVINSLLRLINGQCNLIDKSFGDSNAPLCCCRVLCRHEADSIFFLLLFVVKGRPASWQCAPVPSSFKNERKRRMPRGKKKTLIALLTCFFFYHFVTFYNFCCSNGNLNLQKEKTLCRELRYSSRGDSSDVRQRVPTEFLRQLSALTAFHGGQTHVFLTSFLFSSEIQDNIYSRRTDGWCLCFYRLYRCQCGCAFRRRSALCCCFPTCDRLDTERILITIYDELWIFFPAVDLVQTLLPLRDWELESVRDTKVKWFQEFSYRCRYLYLHLFISRTQTRWRITCKLRPCTKYLAIINKMAHSQVKNWTP